MSNLKKILTVLSLAALATISQASSMHYGSSSDAEKFAASMESDVTSLALNQPTGERFTLKEQTVEYLLEKQNRNQLDEILMRTGKSGHEILLKGESKDAKETLQP